MNTITTDEGQLTCGLGRRLAAMVYDLMLVYAVLFFYSLILNMLLGPAVIQGSRVLYPGSLLLCCYWYYAWQWLHGGQTLGMKAWRIFLVRRDGSRPDWRTATLRFLLAAVSILPFGAGLWWALFDARNRTFYDRYSRTQLVTAG